jgi:hypothetical protein
MSGKGVQGLARNKLLGDLPFELDAVGALAVAFIL